MAPSRSKRGRHAAPAGIPFGAVVVVLVAVIGLVFGLESHLSKDSAIGRGTTTPPATIPATPTTRGTSPTTTPPTPTPSGPAAVVTPGPINSAFPGLTTFRGNATRDNYGEGPLPKHPVILWQYPQSGGLCASSSASGVTKTWCGTGWTGQPNVIPHKDGTIEIREGAYDDHYHFLNGLTGVPLRPDLVTGDLAKGSATSDADGYPLYYGGSRDNFLRVVALDRSKPTVLWSVNSETSVPNPVWNSDWDGAPLEIGDYLLEGGENSWFYVIKLNRHYDSHHLVQVNPKIVMLVPGFDQQELSDLGDDDVSIENSVAFYKGVAYFSNSGGLVQGWDISNILAGGTHFRRVFRFWDGNETDASVVIDPQGFLYVGVHLSSNEPNRRTNFHPLYGALIKLDPRKPNDPVVWQVHMGGSGHDGGLLGTPAYYNRYIYATGEDGEVAEVNALTGKVIWDISLPPPLNGSPVPIDRQLVVGDCAGDLHDFDISNPLKPPKELWRVHLDGCVESTPAVWHGMLWVGARGGKIYGIGDRKA